MIRIEESREGIMDPFNETLALSPEQKSTLPDTERPPLVSYLNMEIMPRRPLSVTLTSILP